MKSSSSFSKFQSSIDANERYQYMSNIPPKTGRYIIVDTETTGMSKSDHIIELGAHEIINGKLTGAQFHIYIKPRIIMSQSIIKIHSITNDYYDKYYQDSYNSDKYNMEQFLKFVGSSLIFAHNAPFDLMFINNELRFWNIQTIEPKRFRCTMRIFYNVVSNVNPLVQSVMNLRKCCEYFNLNVNEEKFHSALFDALMTSKMMCKVYELLEKNKALRENKNVNYTANTIDMFLGGGGGSENGSECREKKKKYSDLYCMINKMKEDKENIEKDPKRKFDNLFYIAKKTMKHVPRYNKSNNSNSNSSITQLNQIQHKSNNNNNNYNNNNKTLNSFINVQPKHEPIKHNDDTTHTHSITNPNISSSPSSDIDNELLQFIEDSNTSPPTT